MAASDHHHESVQLLCVWVSLYSLRAELALAFKGVEYEKVPQDLRNKSKLLLESNPVYQKIPVLIHNGKPIVESSIIVQYIDEAWPAAEGNNLLPSDPYGKAMARFWGDYVDKKLLEGLFGIFRKKGEELKVAIDSAVECLATLEEALGSLGKEPPFFGGATVGYVDIIMGPLVAWFPAMEALGGFKIPFTDRFPLLHAWVEALKGSSIASVLPEPEKVTEFAVQMMGKTSA